MPWRGSISLRALVCLVDRFDRLRFINILDAELARDLLQLLGRDSHSDPIGHGFFDLSPDALLSGFGLVAGAALFGFEFCVKKIPQL